MQSLMVLLRFFSNIFVLIFKLGLLQVAAGSVMIEQRLCSKPVSLLLIDLCMGREAHSKFRPFQIFSGFYFLLECFVAFLLMLESLKSVLLK